MHDKEIKIDHLRDALPCTEDTESPPISTGKPASLDAITKNPPRGLTGRNTKRKMCSKSDKVELDNPYEKSVIDELNKDGEELTHFGPDTRLCSHEKLKDSENYLLCKEYVIDKREEEVISHNRAFDTCIKKMQQKIRVE